MLGLDSGRTVLTQKGNICDRWGLQLQLEPTCFQLCLRFSASGRVSLAVHDKGRLERISKGARTLSLKGPFTQGTGSLGS